MSRTLVSLMMALGILLSLGGLPVSTVIASDGQPRRITVTGQGEQQASPDVAGLSIGVETEAKTPGMALTNNAERMNAVMKRLKDAGIADEDMQTSQLGIWPVFADRQQPRSTVGYRASNQLMVVIRDKDRLGTMLDAAVAAGANHINGPTFSIADPGPLLAAARDAAVKDAITKAERYVAAADLQLGDLISIDEIGAGPTLGRQLRTESVAVSTPIAPGQNTISASVTVTFAIDAKANHP